MSEKRKKEIERCLESRNEVKPLEIGDGKWEIGWIAGFLEGEGSFRLYEHGGVEIKATQVEYDPIRRLIEMLGGNYYLYERSPRAINIWTVKGIMAVRVMKAIEPMMSGKRREEIERCLRGWNGKRGDEKFGG